MILSIALHPPREVHHEGSLQITRCDTQICASFVILKHYKKDKTGRTSQNAIVIEVCVGFEGVVDHRSVAPEIAMVVPRL